MVLALNFLLSHPFEIFDFLLQSLDNFPVLIVSAQLTILNFSVLAISGALGASPIRVIKLLNGIAEFDVDFYQLFDGFF